MLLTNTNIYSVLFIFFQFILHGVSLAGTDSVFKSIYSHNFGNISQIHLIEDTLDFDGYIVFECPKIYVEERETDFKEYFKCKFYFIENLENFNIDEKKLWFDSFKINLTSFYDDCIFHPGKNSEEINYLKFYENYISNYQKNITVVAFMFYPLNTELFFKGIKPWSLISVDSISYFIFKVSVKGTSFEMTRELSTSKDEEQIKKGKKINFLFPISKASIFEPEYDSILISQGFVQSKWLPDYLFNR